MSGECEKYNEHALDCKCGIGCDPPGTIITNKLASLASIEIIPIPDIAVDHPDHYQGKTLEVINIIEDFQLDFVLGNSIKYILRASKKGNKVQDLRKAIWYLERAISQEKSNEQE